MAYRTHLLTAVFLTGLGLAAVPAAYAEDDLSLSGNAALVSDYRFRGVSLSDKDIAIQGGLDAEYNGFYMGTWGSSIEEFNGAETELDLYGGYGVEMENGLALSGGVVAYLYPGGANTDYYELMAALSGKLRGLEWSASVNYAPSQDNIGGTDDVYLNLGASYAIPDTPLSVIGGVGYEDGAFGNDKIDWKLGLETQFHKLKLGVAYIDTDQPGRLAKAGVVLSLSAHF